MCYMAFTLKLKKIPLAHHSSSVPLSAYLPGSSFFYDWKKKIRNSGFLITVKVVLECVCAKGREGFSYFFNRINQYSFFFNRGKKDGERRISKETKRAVSVHTSPRAQAPMVIHRLYGHVLPGSGSQGVS